MDSSLNGLRVLILHSRYASGVTSGENRVVDDEERLLRTNGIEVRSWTPQPQDSNTLQRAGLAARAIWSRDADLNIRRIVSEFNPSIVHIHNLFPMLSPVAIRTIRKLRIPVVMTLHNYRLQCLPATLLRDGQPCTDCVGKLPWRGVYHRCFRDSLIGSATLASSLSVHRLIKTFEDVTLYLPISKFVQSQYERAGMRSEKMRLKPNFAWPALGRKGAGEYFLYLGRLTEEKGVLTLVRGWSSSFPPLRVVGEGPLFDLIAREVRSNVELRRPVEDVSEELRSARAVILPSLWPEPAGRVILEAAACGVPSIVTDQGGMKEFVGHRSTGIVTCLEKLMSAVNDLSDDQTSLRLGAGALDLWRKQYSPEGALEQLLRIYDKALSL